MSKTKKALLNSLLCIIGFALLTGILFFAISPGVPTNQLDSDGVEICYLSLPNGMYLGDSIAGILSGEGTFEFDTGEIYEGSWSMHNMSGKGKLSGSVGVYEGDFENSQRSGNGTFVWSDGAKYVGLWAADKMNGDGVLTTSENVVYTGTFTNNIFADGTISLDNETAKYTLTVSDGEVSETINVVFDNGVIYEGDFEGTEISGKGVMVFPEQGTYDGSFKNGKREGDGEFTWTSGESYDGAWKNDLMDGYGKYTFKNGTYVTGTFKEGVLDGKYTYYTANGRFSTLWESGTCVSVSK